MGRRRRRKDPRTEREAAAHGVPDEVLELVFFRLASLLHLVRAAGTCKRWRRVIADSGFLRRFRSLHAASLVAGHYRVDERGAHPRPPGRNPVFVPSPSISLDARRFSLDFLPRTNARRYWELADSRGGLLLFVNGPTASDEAAACPRPSLVVCEPLTRTYRVIPPSAWSHGCESFGAFLLDGDADDAGGCISLSNFRLVRALYCSGVARACVFSSQDGGRWTSPASGTAICGDDYWSAFDVYDFAFAGSDGRYAYWRMGPGPFGHGARDLVLDKDAAEFSCCIHSENMHVDLQTEFVYQLAWPPAIRACLTL
jgi:hypothetical protein